MARVKTDGSVNELKRPRVTLQQAALILAGLSLAAVALAALVIHARRPPLHTSCGDSPALALSGGCRFDVPRFRLADARMLRRGHHLRVYIFPMAGNSTLERTEPKLSLWTQARKGERGTMGYLGVFTSSTVPSAGDSCTGRLNVGG